MKENKILSEVRDKAAKILADVPSMKEKMLKNISDAENAVLTAQSVMESTLSEKEYYDAEEKIKEAEARIALANRLLRRYENSPRMNEDEYNAAVESCKTEMMKARDKARTVIDKIVPELYAVIQEYRETARDVTTTLKMLDDAANILQPKHGTRWTWYTTRYDNAKDQELFVNDKNEDKPYAYHHSLYDYAWRCLGAYPDKMF